MQESIMSPSRQRKDWKLMKPRDNEQTRNSKTYRDFDLSKF